MFVDKTFAVSPQAALRMAQKTEQHNSPFFSSSCLRYSDEIIALRENKATLSKIEYMATLGPGSYDNYVVHQLEQIVSVMGVGAKRVKSLSTKNGRELFIDYGDGTRCEAKKNSIVL